MRKILKRKSGFCIALLTMLLFSSMVVSAKTESFSGTMNYRVLDGSSNGVYYSFDGKKTLKMSGTVKVYDTTNYGGTPNTTYVCCYEKTGSGSGNLICDASVTAYYDGTSYSFSDTGTTINTSDKYYIMCYKIEDDGFDVKISGTLSTD